MLKRLALIAAPAALVLFGATSVPAGPEAPAAAAATDYRIDGTHSSVVFKIKHAGASWFYGTFEAIAGSLTVDEADPTRSSIEVEIEAGSVDSDSEQRDGHILSPDFLSAKEFPKIRFVSTAVKDRGEGNLEVTGDLTFRGITKPITADVTHVGKGEFQGQRIGYEARFSFPRSDFGSDFGIDNGSLGDEVSMIVSIEGVSK